MDDNYTLSDEKLSIHSLIYAAKKENKNEVFWKPLLPTTAEVIDDIFLYVIMQQGCKIQPVDDGFKISW